MTGLGTLGAQGVRVHLSDAPPGARALLLLGLSSTTWGPLSLGASGLPGCGVAPGHAFVDLLAPLAQPGQLTIHGQWLVLDSGSRPGGLSAGMQWQH